MERYATSFEAGFLQRRSEEEAKDMMEKVSTLKEYEKERAQAQRDGSEGNANGEIQTEGVAATKETQGLNDASRVLNLDDGRASQLRAINRMPRSRRKPHIPLPQRRSSGRCEG